MTPDDMLCVYAEHLSTATAVQLGAPILQEAVRRTPEIGGAGEAEVRGLVKKCPARAYGTVLAMDVVAR